MMFDNCNKGCRHVDDYGNGDNVEIVCNECMRDSHHVRIMNKDVCVRSEMIWDCQERAAMMDSTHATAAMPALPQGPADCNKCAMLGSHIACLDCKEGFYVDQMTGTCMKHEDKKDYGTEPDMHMIACPSHMMHSCSACMEAMIDMNGNMQAMQMCFLCKPGFVKGSMGNCYENSASMGEECPASANMEHCDMCR
jgi:hypothetical protein